MRVKIVRNSGKYQAGQVLVMNRDLAYKLVQDGVAELTKDMTPADYNASSTRRLRSNNGL